MKKIFTTLLLLVSFLGFTKAQECSCTDPLNILDGSDVLFFHRTLVLDIGHPNLAVQVFGMWNDETGSPVVGPVNAMTNDEGILEFEFYSPPGIAYNFDVHYNPGPGELALNFIGVACDACTSVIPTMGEWGILCLMLMLGIFGVLYARKVSSLASVKK